MPEHQTCFNFGRPERPRRKLIKPEEAHATTENAIARAEGLTSDDRKQILLEAVERAARTYMFFTADQVWDLLGEVGDEFDNGSGLGPVMRMALNDSLIASTGTFRRSERPPMHGKPMRVWKSLIYVLNAPAA